MPFKIMFNKGFLHSISVMGIIFLLHATSHATSSGQLFKDFIIQRMMLAKIREYNHDPTAESLKAALKNEAKNAGIDIPKWFSSSDVPIYSRRVDKASTPEEIDRLIEKASKIHGVDQALIKAVIKVESSFDAKAVSKKGAKGLMQIMDGTAQEIGLINPFDPKANIIGGTKLLKKYLLKYKSVKRALIAYNAGEGYLLNSKKIPKETQLYITKVIDSYLSYKN